MAAYDRTPKPVAWPHSYNPTGLPGLGATNTHSIASWDQPHTSPTTIPAGYDLPPMPVARPRYDLQPTPVTRPRSEYTAAAATANPTALATLFVPQDLEAFAYIPLTPSSVLAPATTDAHHEHAMPLDLTTTMANSPALATLSSVQPRQINCPYHVIRSTRPRCPTPANTRSRRRRLLMHTRPLSLLSTPAPSHSSAMTTCHTKDSPESPRPSRTTRTGTLSTSWPRATPRLSTWQHP